MQKIAAAGNTVVPALLALEGLGFVISIERTGGLETIHATRGEEVYLADDPVTVLGLVKLVESRGWDWKASDREIDEVERRHHLF